MIPSVDHRAGEWAYRVYFDQKKIWDGERGKRYWDKEDWSRDDRSKGDWDKEDLCNRDVTRELGKGRFGQERL